MENKYVNKHCPGIYLNEYEISPKVVYGRGITGVKNIYGGGRFDAFDRYVPKTVDYQEKTHVEYIKYKHDNCDLFIQFSVTNNVAQDVGALKAKSERMMPIHVDVYKVEKPKGKVGKALSRLGDKLNLPLNKKVMFSKDVDCLYPESSRPEFVYDRRLPDDIAPIVMEAAKMIKEKGHPLHQIEQDKLLQVEIQKDAERRAQMESEKQNGTNASEKDQNKSNVFVKLFRKSKNY